MFKNYLKTAWRSLWKNKGYSTINILGLSIGTLCCLYIVLYVRDQRNYDRQHKDVADIYRINTEWTVQGDKANWATVTGPVAPAMKKDFPEVLDFARIVPAIGIDHHLLRYKEKGIYETDAVFADPSLFTIFNFHFEYGNGRDALQHPYSIVLMQAASEKLFGKEDPLGKIIQVDNAYGNNNFTVTGVIDESLGKSHIKADMFMSMNSGGLGGFIGNDNSWAGNNVAVSYIRLQPGSNVLALDKKLPAFLEKNGGNQLKSVGMSKVLSLQPVQTIHTTSGFRGLELSKPVSPSFMYFLMLIAGLIQLIACINFMNLATARASRRTKEVGVRKVIGATRANLVQQFLGESFLLSLLSVLIALPLLVLALPFLNRIAHADISLTSFGDFRIWLTLIVLLTITGLLAGSYPALYLSTFQPIKVFKGKATGLLSTTNIRRSLVVFQFVLSIVMISSIVIIYHQLNYIKKKDLGFDQKQKLVFSLYTDDAVAHIPAFVKDLAGLAGVNVVSRANNSPGQPVLYDAHLFLAGGNIATAPDASLFDADENYLKATGIKLVSGRDFRKFDTGKVIINEALAAALTLNVNKAEGTQLFTQHGDGTPATYEIAGVVKNYNFSSLRETIKPMFIEYAPAAGGEVIISSSSGNYKALLGRIETIWHRDFPSVPFDYSFVDESVQKQYLAENTLSNIINSFTLVAILISCLGLFGLVSFTAEQRKKEIGVRKVLGASVAGIAKSLSYEFVKYVLLSLIIATPIAWFVMNKWLADFAYRVPITWWMFATSGIIALFIALATVSFQAVRAALANPVKSLRTE